MRIQVVCENLLTKEIEVARVDVLCPQHPIIIKKGTLKVGPPYNWIILDENEVIKTIKIFYDKGPVKWEINFNKSLKNFCHIIFGGEWIPEIAIPSGENFCLLPEGYNERFKKQNQPMLCGIG